MKWRGEGSIFITCDSFYKLLDFDSQEGDTISDKCTYKNESANLQVTLKKIRSLTISISFTSKLYYKYKNKKIIWTYYKK